MLRGTKAVCTHEAHHMLERLRTEGNRTISSGGAADNEQLVLSSDESRRQLFAMIRCKQIPFN